MNLERISIVSVPVSDQTAARRFYVEILGFSVLRDDAMGPDRRWIQLSPPCGGPSITLVTWFDAMLPGCQQGLVISAADVESAHKGLKARGAGVSDVQSVPWGRYFTFEDPDGNGWVVQGPPAPGD